LVGFAKGILACFCERQFFYAGFKIVFFCWSPNPETVLNIDLADAHCLEVAWQSKTLSLQALEGAV